MEIRRDMELLVANKLSLLVQGSPLFEALDITLRRGERIGLVGANGSGKSTLLTLLAGERMPDGGRVARAPGLRLERVAQDVAPPPVPVRALVAGALRHLDELEASLRAEERRLAAGEERLEPYGRLLESFEAAGGYRAEAEAWAALEAFGIVEAVWDRRADTLSGGERRRLHLALALAGHPDVLLIDEPTNHLDVSMRRALAERLADYPGGLLLASHDRALLDRVCTHIALLERGGLTLRRGDYSAFERRRRAARTSSARRARERAKEEARIIETVAQLRSFGNAAAQRRRKRFERRLSELREAADRVPTDRQPAALGHKPLPSSGTLLAAEHLSKRRDGHTVVDDVCVTITAGDRVALVGVNGSGKSTLLALLAGTLSSDDPRARLRYGSGVRLAFADQHGRGIETGATPLEVLEQSVVTERARRLLAEAGVPAERWQIPSEALSGGERAQLSLARIVASEANLLLLDEPAVDLDLDGIERLERTLIDGAATLLFSSHDQRLIERVATRLWSLEGGELVEYRGGFPGFVAGTRRREAEPTEPTDFERPIDPEAAEHGGDGDAAADSDAEDADSQLEIELAAIEDALSDPLRLSERARNRLERRRRALIEALSNLYDARYPAPLPRFAVRESGLEVRADLRSGALGLDLLTPLPLAIEVRIVGDVAHLRLGNRRDLCPLDWAIAAVVTSCARLCIYLLPVRAVQLQYERDLSATPFTAAGRDWWLLSRSALERLEGWQRSEIGPPQQGG